MKIEDISHATEGLKKDNQHQFFVKKMGVIFGLDYKARKSKLYTEDGRSMTTFYYCSVNHQSGLQSNTFLKLSYIFLIHQNVPQIMSFHLRYMMVS